MSTSNFCSSCNKRIVWSKRLLRWLHVRITPISYDRHRPSPGGKALGS